MLYEPVVSAVLLRERSGISDADGVRRLRNSALYAFAELYMALGCATVGSLASERSSLKSSKAGRAILKV